MEIPVVRKLAFFGGTGPDLNLGIRIEGNLEEAANCERTNTLVNNLTAIFY